VCCAAAAADANWALNGLKSSKHESVTMDAFEFLERAAAGKADLKFRLPGDLLFPGVILACPCNLLAHSMPHILHCSPAKT
jgi:hypothetical protein